MLSMSQVLKLSYLPLGVALTSQFTLTMFQKLLSSLISFTQLEESKILQVIWFKPCQLLSFQTSVTSFIDMITIPLNSGNVQVISSGIFTVKSTKRPRLLILCHYFHARIHGILARKTKVMTSSKLGKWCSKPLILDLWKRWIVAQIDWPFKLVMCSRN